MSSVSYKDMLVIADSLQILVAEDMNAVDACIRRHLRSNVSLVNQVAEYIIQGGGKRLRPLLTILVAKSLGYSGDYHHTLAAVVELIHTATLLHDDVVDKSELRRGRETANEMFGNEASVLVGDFIYSRSFQMMVSVDRLDVMRILSDATNVIAEGEVLQLMNSHDPDITEQQYFQVIGYKTAQLFEAAARLGAVLNNASAEVEQAVASFGRELGVAFQIIDDVLDYSGDPQVTGKNVGDDLNEGKVTLPLLLALRHVSEIDRLFLRQAITDGGVVHWSRVVELIQNSGVLSIAHQRAVSGIEQAIQVLLQQVPPTPYRDGLVYLARVAVERTQ